MMIVVPLFLGIGGQELLVIALLLLLLFGGKKIPELMKGLGKGVRSFKEGLNDVEKSIDPEVSTGDKKETKEEQKKE